MTAGDDRAGAATVAYRMDRLLLAVLGPVLVSLGWTFVGLWDHDWHRVLVVWACTCLIWIGVCMGAMCAVVKQGERDV